VQQQSSFSNKINKITIKHHITIEEKNYMDVDRRVVYFLIAIVPTFQWLLISLLNFYLFFLGMFKTTEALFFIFLPNTLTFFILILNLFLIIRLGKISRKLRKISIISQLIGVASFIAFYYYNSSLHDYGIISCILIILISIILLFELINNKCSDVSK
jgi:hypothetical protein